MITIEAKYRAKFKSGRIMERGEIVKRKELTDEEFEEAKRDPGVFIIRDDKSEKPKDDKSEKPKFEKKGGDS